MTEDKSAIINHNLRLIFQTESQSLHKRSFKNLNGKRLSDIDKWIETMEKYDLIESERNPNIYFLTEFGYNCLENNGWNDPNMIPEPFNYNENEGEIYNDTPKSKASNAFVSALVIFLLSITIKLIINNYSTSSNTDFTLPKNFEHHIQYQLKEINGKEVILLNTEDTILINTIKNSEFYP